MDGRLPLTQENLSHSLSNQKQRCWKWRLWDRPSWREYSLDRRSQSRRRQDWCKRRWKWWDKVIRTKRGWCTIGAADDMLLSLVLPLLTTLFLLLSPCDRGKETQHRMTPNTPHRGKPATLRGRQHKNREYAAQPPNGDTYQRPAPPLWPKSLSTERLPR